VQTFDFLSLFATVIDRAVPVILLIASVATLTGNYLSKRFFEDCGLGLRARYLLAALMAVVGLAFAVGFHSPFASKMMIATLLVLSALALRTGARVKSVSMAAIASALLVAEAPI
jgi:hypothetical protein